MKEYLHKFNSVKVQVPQSLSPETRLGYIVESYGDGWYLVNLYGELVDARIDELALLSSTRKDNVHNFTVHCIRLLINSSLFIASLLGLFLVLIAIVTSIARLL